MTKLFNTGLSCAAAIAVLGLATSVSADGRFKNLPPYGSLKDTPVQIVDQPVAATGNCYVSAAGGYSWTKNPDTYLHSTIGPGHNGSLSSVKLSDSWMYEFGIGCGTTDPIMSMGQSGAKIRGEFALGVRRERDFTAQPGNVFTPEDFVLTNLTTYTAMFNVYKDFGNYSGFMPYIGAGIGIAIHDMDNVQIQHNSVGYVLVGDSETDFAWSLTTGFGYDLGRNFILDVGYRYINMGTASSGQAIIAGTTGDPELKLEDIEAHELKVGVRYTFGGSY